MYVIHLVIYTKNDSTNIYRISSEKEMNQRVVSVY
jgi:hypothetical protein